MNINTATLTGTVVERATTRKTERSEKVYFKFSQSREYQGKTYTDVFEVEVVGQSKDVAMTLNVGDTITINGKLSSWPKEVNGKTYYNLSLKVFNIVTAGAPEEREIQPEDIQFDDSSIPF